MQAGRADPGGSRPGGDFARQLELIARMSQDFASSLDIDATLRRGLAHITEHVGAEGGAVFLLDETGEELRCHAWTGPVDLTGLRMKATEGIVGRSVRQNSCEIVRDALNDPNFQHRVDERTGFTTRSILCAPLSVQDQCLGAIELVNKKDSEGLFDDDDMHLLQAMASSAALALLNARFAADLVEQERYRREFELAAEIQRSLLPSDCPPPFPLVGINLAARVVSGDFFDYIRLPGNKIAFTIGDVSGKGMRAALLMAKAASLFRCLAKGEARPGHLLAVINQEIAATATRGMFVTMLVGVYDPAKGTVVIANAGHEPPLAHGPDGSFQAFPAREPPVGLALDLGRDKPFPEDEIALDDGTLYTFTDGVTEARLSSGTEVGAEGIRQLIGETAALPVRTRLRTIVERIAGEQLRDDLTILAVDGHTGLEWSRVVEGTTMEVAEDRLLTLRFPAHAARLKHVRSAVENAVARGGCTASCAQDIVRAIDEACQNVIRHAYGGETEQEIVLEIERQKDRLVFWLRDFAPRVDVDKVRPRDLEDVRPGGLGVHIIRQIMDEAGFVPSPSGVGNLFRMTKRIT
jgi:sigma-B regulation protein RsbU (phosphoserine phosphatase)